MINLPDDVPARGFLLVRPSTGERSADRAIDLTNGTEVIREMGDAGDDPVQLDLRVIPRRPECVEPAARLRVSTVSEAGNAIFGHDT